MSKDDSVFNFIQTINYMAATADEGLEFVGRLAGLANDIFMDKRVSQTKIDKFNDAMTDERYGITVQSERNILNEIQDYFENYIETPYYNSLDEYSDDREISSDPAWRDYFDARDQVSTNRSGGTDYTVGNQLKAGIKDFNEDEYENYYNRTLAYNVKKKKNASSKAKTQDPYYDYYSNYYDVEQRDYYVIGYGSLINERSRSRTINTVDEAYVKVKGYTRIFNVGAGGGTVLNVAPNENGWINAVLMKVDWRDMQDLYMREFQYDEYEVPVENISFPYGGKEMKLERPPIIFVSSANVKTEPKFDYVKACIYGATQVSNKFAKDFIKTTRIHDGTPLGRYLMKKYGQGIFKEFKSDDSKY